MKKLIQLAILALAVVTVVGCAGSRSEKPFSYNQVGTTKYHQYVNGKLEEVERAEYNEAIDGKGPIPPGLMRNPYMGSPGRVVNQGQLVNPPAPPAPAPSSPFVPSGSDPGNPFIPKQGGHGSYVPADQPAPQVVADPQAIAAYHHRLRGSYREPAFSDPRFAGDPGYAAYFNSVQAQGGGSNFHY